MFFRYCENDVNYLMLFHITNGKLHIKILKPIYYTCSESNHILYKLMDLCISSNKYRIYNTFL